MYQDVIVSVRHVLMRNVIALQVNLAVVIVVRALLNSIRMSLKERQAKPAALSHFCPHTHTSYLYLYLLYSSHVLKTFFQ